MRPKLKICGITRLEDARFCAAAGADYLGFIQHPDSPRYVDPALAKEIVNWVYGPEPVGVFVNTPPDEVNRLADASGFAFVQLHGTEPPAECARIHCPVIKAIHVRPDHTPARLRELLASYAPHVAYFLLDTHAAGQWGGTGTTFDWTLARTLAPDYPLFLSGGLSAGNVAEAVRTVRPYGLDLASSVEQAPGVKDFDKLAAFFEAFDALEGILPDEPGRADLA